MPLYEYQCRKCGKRTEKIEKFSGPHLKKCPHCGGSVERLLSAPAIQFKGSGWYVTDYAKSSSAATAPASTDTGDSKPAEKSGEKKPAAKEKEKKTAAKEK